MKYFRIILFVLGVFVIVSLGREVGWTVVWQQLSALRWRLFLIFFLTIPKNIIFTFAWNSWLKVRGQKIPFWALFRFKIMESAVNSMSPLHVVGGDLIRIVLLKEYMLMREASSAVLLDRLSQIVSGAILILVSLVFAAQFYSFSAGVLEKALWIASIGCALAASLFYFRHSLYAQWKTEWMGRWARFDHDSLSFIRGHPKIFASAVWWTFVGRLFSPLEIYFILSFLHFSGPATSFSIVLSGALNLITTIFTFVPGQIGVMEGGFALLFRLAGFSVALGLSCQLVRRINALVWIAIGSLLLLVGRRPTINESEVWSKSPQSVP